MLKIKRKFPHKLKTYMFEKFRQNLLSIFVRRYFQQKNKIFLRVYIIFLIIQVFAPGDYGLNTVKNGVNSKSKIYLSSDLACNYSSTLIDNYRNSLNCVLQLTRKTKLSKNSKKRSQFNFSFRRVGRVKSKNENFQTLLLV